MNILYIHSNNNISLVMFVKMFKSMRSKSKVHFLIIINIIYRFFLLWVELMFERLWKLQCLFRMCHVLTQTHTHWVPFGIFQKVKWISQFQVYGNFFQSKEKKSKKYLRKYWWGRLVYWFRLTILFLFAIPKKKTNRFIRMNWQQILFFKDNFFSQFKLFSRSFLDAGRYTLLSTGELLIHNTTFQDSGFYRCQIRHQLTDELRTSDESGRLIVTGKFPKFFLLIEIFSNISMEMFCPLKKKKIISPET